MIIKPKRNTAAFFSYLGPDGRMEEEGYTTHSSCPVLKCEKWAIAVWFRIGVSKEEPWTIFDPSGKKLATEEFSEEEIN